MSPVEGVYVPPYCLDPSSPFFPTLRTHPNPQLRARLMAALKAALSDVCQEYSIDETSKAQEQVGDPQQEAGEGVTRRRSLSCDD